MRSLTHGCASLLSSKLPVLSPTPWKSMRKTWYPWAASLLASLTDNRFRVIDRLKTPPRRRIAQTPLDGPVGRVRMPKI
jgi:hypothetical protein